MMNDLLKVMIVDDENIFREYLQMKIDWKTIGLKVCFEARNGVEAMEQALKVKPDIALLDINMPFMDGLTLSEKLKEVMPGIRIVLITGYSEFEYARRAIKLGIDDYILKPFEDEELIMILIKLKGTILKERGEKAITENSCVLMKEKLLNTLISREYANSEEETEKQLDYLGIKTGSHLFIVASIEIDDMYQRWEDINDIVLWKYAVLNILNEIVEEDGNCITFNGPEERIISIFELNICDNQIANNIQSYQKLCNYVNRYLKFTLTVGLGEVHKGFGGIRKSYIESIVALQNKLTLGNNKVIEYSILRNDFSNVGFFPSEVNEEVLLNLRFNDWEKTKIKIDEVFDYISKKRLSIDYTYIICTGLVSICLSYIIEVGKEIKEIFGEGFLPFGQMKENSSMESLQNWVLGLFKITLQYCGENKNTRLQKIVNSARVYINNNFNQCDINLEQIAASLYINSGYLRAIFKREAGITISDYITKLRMLKAKELLSLGNMKLSVISEMVGYSDASYFSKCFKKYYGASPSDYENVRK
ncbi:MAG TPA: response regulator [Ruminiclostridium sp.]